MAETTSHVLQYIGDITNIRQKVRVLKQLNTQAARQFGSDFAKATDVVSRRVDQLSTKTVKINGKPVQQTFARISTVVRDANGNLKTFTQNARVSNKGLSTLNTTIKNGGNVTRTLGDNLKTLVSRAALTIPVWFALRNSIGAVFSTIRDGVGDIVSFDRILQKARKNLEATSESPQELESNFNRLKESVIEISRETGKSVQDVTSAFQKFATVGFDFETSLQAANTATRASILLFGETEETANAFARTMRVLVDDSDDTASAGDQISDAFAQTVQLWKDNAFELGEFTQSLEKFAPTAATANFTTQQTIATLAALSTGAIRGGRAGRNLRTAIIRLVSDADKLAETLGVRVNPEVDTTFDVFLRTLDALAKLRNETGKVTPEFESLVREIAGLRAGDPIRALIQLREELNKNLAVLPDIGQFNKEFDDINQSTFQLAERFKNLNKELGRTFVVGLTGAEDFNGALVKIVSLLERAEPLAKGLGSGLKFGLGSLVGVSQFNVARDIAIAPFQTQDSTQLREQFQEFVDAIQGNLDDIELKDLAVRINAGDVRLPDDEGFVEELKSRISEQLGTGSIEDAIDVPVRPVIQEGETNNLSLRQRRDIAKEIVDARLEELKLEGATQSEILRAEQNLRKQLDIRQDGLDALKSELELQQAIREEQRLQNRLSSQSVELFRIAQEEGVGVARSIGEVLSGDLGFSDFVRRGGEAVDIFRERFSDLFEQQQALQFFQGRRVTGLEGLRGGSGIDIAEEQIRRTTPIFDPRAGILRARAERQVARDLVETRDVQQTNNINQTFNIEGSDPQQVAEQVSKQFRESLQNPSSETARALKDFTLNI